MSATDNPISDAATMQPRTHAYLLPLRILRPFWLLTLCATVLAGMAGLASAALVATVNRALHADGGQFSAIALAFVALGIVAIVGEVAGSIGNSVVGQRVIAALRRELCDKILTAPIAELERYQPHKLIAALDRDVSTIGVFTFNLSSSAVAFAIVAGCFTYLVLLSPALAAVAALAIAIDVAVQVAAGRRASSNFEAARAGYDDLQKNYRAMIEGAKELRINRPRRLKLRNESLQAAIHTIYGQFVRAISVFFVAKGFNSAIFFATLLIVLSAGVALGADKLALTGFVLTLLYVRGPLEQIVSSLPLFAEAAVSLRRVAELSSAFANDERELLEASGAHAGLTGNAIELRGARYAFPAPTAGEAFVLGPVDLKIERGETVFVSGLNGSGKTTLIKLLLGLYAPQEGRLLCDGRSVGPAERDAYRSLFSTVLFDYYLFEDLMADGAFDAALAESYLERLEIAHKVAISNRAFSTTDLSTGQRKRLALVHVLLENRPIVVLDEWAADQDPAFRAVFYLELLPELKRMGKTLIVVSHDDRYFSAADRLIKLDNGGIVGDVRQTGNVERVPARQS
jgi:putative pyoverdin transport system ATP-binding/permease protein